MQCAMWNIIAGKVDGCRTLHHSSLVTRISSPLAPLTVWTAIFSFLLMPKDLTVYLALKKAGW